MLDLRYPMGMMFALVGAMLAFYGVYTNSSDIYQTHSLGINVNLIWGLALVCFGLVVLGLARWASAKQKRLEGQTR
jgi:hypothetical protein